MWEADALLTIYGTYYTQSLTFFLFVFTLGDTATT